MQKIVDSRGSFIVGKAQILKGTDDSYVSIHNSGSSPSVSCSPQSIRISAFVSTKRDRQPESPIDSQFKVGNRRKLLKGRVTFAKNNQDKNIT